MLSQPSKFHGHMEKAALALHSRKRHNGRSWGKPSCLSRMSWQAMGIWARRKKTCSPLSLLASAQVLIFIISNAKHSPLNKNHQVVVSAFPSTWNKKLETKKLSESSKTTFLQPRCSIIFSGESQVPTSFQSTTSILGTQGSSNWIASNQLKGPFCWWCWGVQILRPGKRLLLLGGEAIIKYRYWACA